MRESDWGSVRVLRRAVDDLSLLGHYARALTTRKTMQRVGQHSPELVKLTGVILVLSNGVVLICIAPPSSTIFTLIHRFRPPP